MYGGGVLVFDEFPADRAVARKASLQQFMEKRRDRLAARAPYAARPASLPALKKLNEKEAEDAECWLGLGVQGRCAC
ncbi:hypothetical protein BAE44_0021174 [Dichanthelium oligosanthes]|uniref:Uncharacterized protein n=1 Tax=Dichanthelium oligosanthes TaxID=888268 RepID=A0A1E5UY73_9POAL|nr:hypothetical protein BAE44_0021174 [Dichanthelium oligosanthes]